MLYERWRQIAHEHRSELALHDLPSGRRWTFSELALATEAGGRSEGSVVFPKGINAEFVWAVLRAWRYGQIVCPLEPDQAPRAFSELPAHCVHLKCTSATTGIPRWVAFNESQLAADSENIVATMGLRPEWPNLGVISLAHSYGFANLVLPLLLHGIPLIIADSPLPESIRRLLPTLPELTLPAVPALWRAWQEAGAIDPRIRRAISAGAPLPLILEQAVLSRTGVKIHNFYGASECGGIAATARSDAACVGVAMKNVHLSVTKEKCLQVRSQAVGQTYWPEASPELSNGCYQTSDLAELSDGLVFLRGRLGDQINVAGRKISPEIIERALLNHPEIRECIVFGVPSADAARGEIIVGCLAVNTRTSAEHLRQFLLAKLPSWQVPREWWFVEALETNQRGKLSRREWRDRYLARQNGEPSLGGESVLTSPDS
jgi:long-chain acyl-CoA synthetase